MSLSSWIIQQRAELGQTQDFVRSYPESYKGCWGMLQLRSQARKKLQEEQNLYDRPSAARCKLLADFSDLNWELGKV